tara:strand:+ start:5990 stop:6556 length:567 start_codon:yes stop_codon:yes gene_type:complete
MYGSRVDAEGKAIQGDSSFVPAVAGERVVGNTLVSIGLAEDKDGNTVETRATLLFKQANGGNVRVTLFEATEGWQFDNLNKQIKHLATKVMTEEEYYAGLEAGGAPSNFTEFINKVAALIMPKAAGKVFTMKFVYKNGYLSVPSFPNWIANPENADTLSTNAKYDKYVAEEASAAPAAAATGTDGNVF